MAKINAVNNQLSGQSGTGNFVGSDSHTLTGDVDFSTSNTLEIPNSATPTLSNAGEIALQTSITSQYPLTKIHDGTEQLFNIGVLSSDLTLTNGDILTYQTNGIKFSPAPVGYSGKIVGFNYSISTTRDTTTSATFVNSSASLSYTPINASNLLIINVYGQGYAEKLGGGNVQDRIMAINLRRTSGVAADLSQGSLARRMAASSASNLQQNLPFNICYTETAGSTSAHTYIIQFRQNSGSTNVTVALESAITPLIMTIYEVSV